MRENNQDQVILTEFEQSTGFSFKGYHENQTFLNTRQNDSAAHTYLQRAMHDELSQLQA